MVDAAKAPKRGDCARCAQLEDEVERLKATISALRRQLSVYEVSAGAATPAVDTSSKGDQLDATQTVGNQW